MKTIIIKKLHIQNSESISIPNCSRTNTNEVDVVRVMSYGDYIEIMYICIYQWPIPGTKQVLYSFEHTNPEKNSIS